MKCVRRPHARYTTCPCDNCRALMRKVSKYARTGRLDRVPSTEAWAKLDEWLKAGFESKWIESAAGTPRHCIQSAITDFRAGHGRRNFGPRYSAAIVNADIWSAREGRAPARGARRRLRALAWMGWTVEALSKETGISAVTLANIQRASCDRLQARLHHPIREAYERLAETSGGSRQAAARARKLGYLPPAAWDDPDTDADQDITDGRRAPDDVDEAVVVRVLNGERMWCTRAERVEIVHRWRASGRPLRDLVELTGWQLYGDRKVA